MGEVHLVVFPDSLKAGNPCNLLRKPDLPRLSDQKEPEILQDLSHVSQILQKGGGRHRILSWIVLTLGRNKSQILCNPGVTYVILMWPPPFHCTNHTAHWNVNGDKRVCFPKLMKFLFCTRCFWKKSLSHLHLLQILWDVKRYRKV